MTEKTTILIVADSPVLPSSGAETIRTVFEPLARRFPDQYELHQIGLAHCFAVTRPTWPVYPTKTGKRRDGKLRFTADDLNGEATLRETVPRIRPDIVFAVNNARSLSVLCSERAEREYKLVLYLKPEGFPIDSETARLLSQADLLVTSSYWSRSQLLACAPLIRGDMVTVVYSPADTDRFGPLTAAERQELRQTLLPDWMPQNAFLLGWVGLPRWSKQVWILYKLVHYLRTGMYQVCSDCGWITPFDWDPVAQRHLCGTDGVLESRPGQDWEACAECGSVNVQRAEPLHDVFLWLHIPPDDPRSDWPLRWLEQEYGVRRNQDIYYTKGLAAQTALAPGDMPALYQLWDCLLYLSGGEGFGLPAWEAMCSGLPVVYSNYSSHAEFLGRAGAGLPVDGVLQPENKTGFWRMIADVPQTIEAVRKIYFNRQLGQTMGANGRSFVQQYTLEIQAERWHQIFQRLQSSDLGVLAKEGDFHTSIP